MSTRDVEAPPAARPVAPVAILAAALDDLVIRAEATAPELLDDLRAARDLAAGLDPYLGAATTPESPVLRRLAERTAAHDWSGGEGTAAPLEREMLSGHVEGQLLKTLVRATRARRVLDIGLFTGYSALAMAEALPDDGVVVACELDPGVAAFAQEGFEESPAGRRIDVRVGPAAETLATLARSGTSFDLVFIDADKGGYTGYLDAVLEGGLLAPHGLVCVDNTMMQGDPWTTGGSTANGAAIAAFNRAVQADPRVEQVMVPLRDGLTLITRAPVVAP